ncbi:MAG: hypothetical protein A3F46_09230 [Legionellales bacterium RIFCSPHIGHO2_12_FULL_42_9]|nr:MAG: hypothetical protein A3F46_09230 [Legionellales bacterium RIFCSPHIGHO2_12_FULL_42_9]
MLFKIYASLVVMGILSSCAAPYYTKCRISCSNCNSYALTVATKKYKNFVQEQTIQSGVITRSINSYRDPLECRKTACNCNEE